MANPSATRDDDRANSEIGLELREMPPQRRFDLVWRIIDGETVILNREAGVLHRLNPTASFIWNCCDGIARMGDIVDHLANAYDVDIVTCRKDVNEVVSKLRALNLLKS